MMWPHVTDKDTAPEEEEEEGEGEGLEEGVQHAILVGVISRSQYLAESHHHYRGSSEERKQMSEQVSSR